LGWGFQLKREFAVVPTDKICSPNMAPTKNIGHTFSIKPGANIQIVDYFDHGYVEEKKINDT
jgi:hypothetical protein